MTPANGSVNGSVSPDPVWLRPRTLDEAAAGLRAGRTVIGGGAALASESFPPVLGPHALDLGSLGLAGIDGDYVGAMTTLEQVLGAGAWTADRPALAAAVRAIATPEVRRVATVGGSVAARLPTSDLTPVLCAHRAHLDLLLPDGGRRRIPVVDYSRDAVAGIVLGVDVGPGLPGAFRRFAGRPGFAPAIASVAAVRHPDGVDVWAGAVATAPIPIAADLPPAGQLRADEHASAWYRRRLLGVLRRDVLADLELIPT